MKTAETAPDAEEAIKYQMATSVLNGNLVHFAVWKKHIGFYHPSAAYETLKDELSVYAGSKGSLKFPLDKPMPFGPISKVVRIKVKENLERAKAKGTKK